MTRHVDFTSPDTATSLSHGAWIRTGPCAFADMDTAFIYDAAGNAAFTITFKANIELRKGGDTGVFDFGCEVRNLDGTLVSSGGSTATGARIGVSPR